MSCYGKSKEGTWGAYLVGEYKANLQALHWREFFSQNAANLRTLRLLEWWMMEPVIFVVSSFWFWGVFCGEDACFVLFFLFILLPMKNMSQNNRSCPCYFQFLHIGRMNSFLLYKSITFCETEISADYTSVKWKSRKHCCSHQTKVNFYYFLPVRTEAR